MSPRVLKLPSAWAQSTLVLDVFVLVLLVVVVAKTLSLVPWILFCVPFIWIPYRCAPGAFNLLVWGMWSDLSTCVPFESLSLSNWRPITVTSVNSASSFTTPVSLQGVSELALIDTGSAVSMISVDLLARLPHSPPLTSNSLPRLQSVTSSSVDVLGKLTLPICIDGRDFVHSFLVARIQPDLVLGLDFLDPHACTLDVSQRKLSFPVTSDLAPVTHFSAAMCSDISDSPAPVFHVHLKEHVSVEPYSHVIVPVTVDSHVPSGDFVLEPLPKFLDRHDLSAAHSLISGENSANAVFRFVNRNRNTVHLPSGTCVGTLTSCSVDATPPPAPVDPIDSLPVHSTSPVDTKSVASLFDLTHLSESERAAVSVFLEEFACCISTEQYDFGRTDVVRHHIDTGDARPSRQAPRRLPVHQESDVRAHVDSLLEDGIIKPSSSPWAAPIVVVRKPDNSIRLCVDYRKLNNLTRKDAFPLPRVDDAIDHMTGAQFFSTLDLASGYWQVELDAASQAKAAFTTPFGLYEWEVMPFGLCNAPATFQRLMTTVLHGLIPDTCLDYLDDIIVPSPSFSDQLQRLRRVFERLRSAGLKVRPAKCRLFQSSVPYLGHTFSAAGVAPNRQKTDAVREWPTPDSPTKVRQFLRFVSYYRRYIPNFSGVARPLHELTQKRVAFAWSDKAQSAFDTLKSRLLSAPILQYPNPARNFILDTDASDFAMGAVLSQLDDQGSEVVIAYASSTLSSSQRSYTATNRECLAVVHFCEHFRHYLLGSRFTLRTDHAAWVGLPLLSPRMVC